MTSLLEKNVAKSIENKSLQNNLKLSNSFFDWTKFHVSTKVRSKSRKLTITNLSKNDIYTSYYLILILLTEKKSENKLVFDLENKILEIFDLTYTGEKVRDFFCKNLHSVGCATVCSNKVRSR